ncbi:histidine kinase [Paenibacillus dendritiformis]|uniref:sensor histidine kinase n=1 Tax=Paenibacillus dendritiformis TaxID=130049 RepID=UPI00143D5DF8|nr:histidine kinase [Paenibacillus dendritiformis]NKI23372.1 histidine kinase [Paenibacillus dendritiformis]NRF96847.1 histidine kinase [Paenibacillus dendritiformis]
MQKSNKFKDYIRKTFVRSGAILVLLIFALFILSLLLTFRETIVQTNRSYNAGLSRLIEKEVQQYSEGLDRLAEDPTVRAVFDNKNVSIEVNQLLYRFVNDRKIKASFVLLDRKQHIVSTNFYQSDQETLSNSYVLKDLLLKLQEQEKGVYGGINKISFGQFRKSPYVLAKPITSGNEVRGYLLLFLADLGACIHTRDADMVVVADRFDNIIYTSHDSLRNGMGKSTIPYRTDQKIIAFHDSYYYMTANETGNGNFHILTMTSMNSFKQFLVIGIVILLGSGLILLALIHLVVPKLMKRNLQSFDSFISAVDQYKQGNMDYRLEARTFDEFQTIYDEFNNMMSKIQLLMKHNDEIAERKRKMEIKHLENQFNPHFVFNVLEMLRYEMLLDAKNASNIVVMFANLMRYYIHYGNGEVALHTDIGYMEDYLRLQKMRFNTRLDYEMDIDPALLDYKIPKLLLQPIIENSIKHGLEYTKHLLIRITIRQVGDDIQIAVEDNGQGMEEERLDYIRKLLDDKDAMPEHVGLYNSHRVMQLLYGPAYGLSIQSKHGAGTTVIARIPYIGDVNNV